MLKLKGLLDDFQETTQDDTKVVVAPEVNAPFTGSGDSFTQLDLAEVFNVLFRLLALLMR